MRPFPKEVLALPAMSARVYAQEVHGVPLSDGFPRPLPAETPAEYRERPDPVQLRRVNTFGRPRIVFPEEHLVDLCAGVVYRDLDYH